MTMRASQLIGLPFFPASFFNWSYRSLGREIMLLGACRLPFLFLAMSNI